MAVTINKKIWVSPPGVSSTYQELVKVVFTSPNIDTPAVAGTRSHAQPGAKYLGTWYETTDYMYRIVNDQGDGTGFDGFFPKLTLLSGTFDFASDTELSVWHDYGVGAFGGDGFKLSTPTEPSIIYFDRDNYGIIGQDSYASYEDTTTISGVEKGMVYVRFDSVVGDTVISGTLVTVSGSNLYYQEYEESYSIDSRLNKDSSIIFDVTFGEAYNCKLTAWDDDTHSTTNNSLIDGEHYVVDVSALKTSNTDFYTGGFINEKSLVYPPSYEQVLKGDEFYYGYFDLIHNIEPNMYGEYLVFFPRLINLDDSIVAGNYDFVTTLHYQYT
jgi:hypothetical protein